LATYGFEVSVNDANGMKGFQPSQKLLEDHLHLASIEGSDMLDDAVKVGKHELHDDIQLIIPWIEGKAPQGNYIGMAVKHPHDSDLTQSMAGFPIIPGHRLNTLDGDLLLWYEQCGE